MRASVAYPRLVVGIPRVWRMLRHPGDEAYHFMSAVGPESELGSCETPVWCFNWLKIFLRVTTSSTTYVLKFKLVQ